MSATNNSNYCSFIHESLLYIDNCSWSSNISSQHIWPLLITSSPRSATKFLTHIFHSIGIKVKHDWYSPKKNDDGQISWINAFYDKNEFGPSRLHNGRFQNIFHLIRDPLKSITSLCTEPILDEPKYLSFIQRHINIPHINNLNSIEFVMQFWYKWNKKLNKFGFPTFKVEYIIDSDAYDNKTCIYTLNWILSKSKLLNKVNDIDLLNGKMSDNLYLNLHKKPANKREHRRTLTWDELFLLNETYAMKIWNLAKKYGYKYKWDYNTFKEITRLKHPFAKNPYEYIKCDSDQWLQMDNTKLQLVYRLFGNKSFSHGI